MIPKKFTRKIEDFVCKHCGFRVKGTGYTNHCPRCLWSRHVDINPGDRANRCQGMMEPARVEKKGDELILVYICEKCRETKKNKVGKSDDLEKVIEIMRE